MANVVDQEDPSRSDAWLKLSRALRGMFWPMLFIGLNFYIGVNSIRFNLLPTALGWFWMYRVLKLVVQLSPMILFMRRLALCLVVLWIPFVIEYVPRRIKPGVRFNLPELPTIDYWTWGTGQLTSLAALMMALYFWCLGGLIIKLALSKDNQRLAFGGRLWRVLYVIPMVLVPWLSGLMHVAWTAFAGVMIVYTLSQLVAVIGFIVLILNAAGFCHQQAFAAEGSSPDLSGKESSALENALRTDDPRKPFRFSLWTIILLMTVIGMASSQIHLIRASQEANQSLAVSREEAAFYRTQLEQLYVYEDEKVFIRHVESLDAQRKKWRVYVPKDGVFFMKAKFSEIPYEGIPEGIPDIELHLPGGTSTVVLDVDDDRGRYGSATLSIAWEQPQSGIVIIGGRNVEQEKPMMVQQEYSLTVDQQKLYWASSAREEPIFHSNGRTPIDVDKPIVLHRYENYTKSPPSPSEKSYSERRSIGAMLWIEKVGP